MHSLARRTVLALPWLCALACSGDTGAGGDPSVTAADSTLATRPDVLEALSALPGVASVRETGLGAAGMRAFTFTIEQPIDHSQPALGTFTQRVQLRHRAETAPTVLASTGYSLFSPSPSDSEPSYLLDANAITVEHRFFGPSTPLTTSNGGEPSAEAWSYMTVKQAADDHHHVVELLKQIYTGPWISSGASKGGQTSIYHYRFYPTDLAGVVAYVAPHSYGSDDQRYVDFLEHVGDASCRDKIIALQRDILMRRSELFPRFQMQASSQGLTFEAIGIEPAFEHLVQEFRVAFWQYGSLADCSTLPQPGASAASLLGAVTDLVPTNLSSDQNLRSVRSFETYYYQAAVELGQYGPLEQHLEGLIEHPGTYTMDNYAPPVPSRMFNPATMIDIGEWVKTQAEHIIFVYGQNDPWTAGAYEFDPVRDIHAFVVPDGNHGASLTARSLPPESLDLAFQVLESWTGVTPQRLDAAAMARAEEGEELFFHLPPRRLRL
jgi:hypothetical protein